MEEELSMKRKKCTGLMKKQVIRSGEEEHAHNHNINSGFHVLAVDDSLIDRKMVEKLLTLSSYNVTCVESGDKALEYLGLVDHTPLDQDHDIDDHHDSTIHHSPPSANDPHHQEQDGQGARVSLIMTDYSMPGMSGYDLLKRVKGSFWKDVPVVVMSSENVPSRIHMCLEGGAEEFLLKPVSLSDLKKLRPYILKSTTTTATAGRHSCEETNTIGAGSSCNLVVNCTTNYDYKEGIMSDDKGQQGKVKVDNESFDARPNLAGLTAA